MTKIVATDLRTGTQFINPYLVNRGQGWGKTWILHIAIANALHPNFIVEGDNEQDVLDEFVDSQYGHLIEADPEDWHEDDLSTAGNESKTIITHNLYMARCKVDYGDYLLKDMDEDAYEGWLRDLFLSIPDDMSALRYKLRWSPAIMTALKAEFIEEWRDYVEEQNAEKSDDDYNATIAGKEPKDD